MEIKEIQKVVRDNFGDVIFGHETEDEIASYIYSNYPGDYIVTINHAGWAGIKVDFTFTTPADELIFRLTHL